MRIDLSVSAISNASGADVMRHVGETPHLSGGLRNARQVVTNRGDAIAVLAPLGGRPTATRLLAARPRMVSVAVATVVCLAAIVLLFGARASVALAAGAGSGSSSGSGSGTGLSAAGATGVPSAPVPLGLGGGGPALSGHGALSAAPATTTTKSTLAAAAVHPDTGGTNTPEAPTTLTEIPFTLTAVESTTPTLSAVYNNATSSYTGYVQYEVLTPAGQVLATGEGTTVSPGSVSTWNYPTTDAPLQVGRQYDIDAESVSGTANSGYDTTGSFWVDPRLSWGTQPWMTNQTWTPDSQMTVHVNVASGDLNISMAMLQTEAGVNLPIDLNFVETASQDEASSEQTHKIAYDWLDTFGEHLYIDPTGKSITYFGPDGESAAFIKNGSSWNAPGDIPATLTTSGSGYQLAWNTSDSDHAAGQVDTYSSTGDMTQEESATGQTLSIAYNSSNEPATMTTSAGRTFDFNYYTSGSLSGYLENIQQAGTGASFEVQLGYNSSDLLTSVENPDGGITQFGYQALHNQITSITTPAGRELLIGYDATAGAQVVSVAQQDTDFSTNPTWNFTYNKSAYTTGGTQCMTSTYSGSFECGSTVVEDPNAHNTTYVWDNAGRVTNTTDANGESQAVTWNSDNDVVSLTNSASQVESFTWDSTHDVLEDITNPQETLSGGGTTPGGVMQLTWSFATAPYTLTQVQDKTNTSSTLTYTYNADHEVSEVQDGLTTYNTEYAYYQGIGGVSCGGLTGDLCSTKDFDGNTTSYAYNSAGELTSITPPTNTGTQVGATSFGYNALGQVTSEEDGRSADTTDYQWNGEGQITKVTYQDGSCVQLNYDADGNLLSEDAPGGDSTFTINAAGLEKTSDINGDSTAYTYDPVGNLETMDGPLGDTSYSYTAINELYQVTDPWANTTTFAYEPTNDQLVHTVSLPGSITETYGYDNANRVTSYTAANGSGNLITDSYSYLTSGTSPTDANLLQSSTNTAGRTTSYTYDALERLTSASATSGGTSYSYGYNADGGVTSQDIGGTTASTTLNTNNENAADSYNAAGDLTSDSSIGTFAYNPAGQTSSITPSGGSAESIGYLADGQTAPNAIGSIDLTYNAIGIDDSATNEFLRTPDGQLLAEYSGGHPYYYLIDPTGSVVGLANTSGTLVNSDSYSPYGVQTATLSGISNPFEYESGYTVPGTTLLHFGDRYYSPNKATWTQLDPTGQNAAYVYAGDDPINLSDPSGLCFIVSCGTYHAIGNALSSDATYVSEHGADILTGCVGLALKAYELGPDGIAAACAVGGAAGYFGADLGAAYDQSGGG
jgi:RHS repeat-associated protein